MSISKVLSEKNPFAVHRRKKMRNRLINKEVTFLCPNCIGGILFHDLGLKFLSPTVNLMMLQDEFVDFILNLDDYLKGDFVFYKHKEYSCPCAYLKAEGLKDIRIHFTHYKDEKTAIEKWNERVKRINKDNIFVFLTERDGIKEEKIKSLKKLNVKGLVVFTANDYPDIPYALQIKKYQKDGEVGNILKKSYFNDSREYERYFDFVKWFNESSGEDYNIRDYVIRSK